MSLSVHVKKEDGSDEEFDDLKDSQINEYKEPVYKFFQFRTFKLKCSNGDFGCPFCDYKVEHQQCQYVHLLLHAIRVGEGSENGKHRANHFAMARYLVIDLADEFKVEVDRFLKGEMDAIDKVLHLEKELDEKEKTLKNLLKENEDLKRSNQNLLAREQKHNAELKGVREKLIKGLNDWQSGKKSGIGIKQMGEIDVDVFKRVCSKKPRPSEVEITPEALCSRWKELLKNSEWHPFRMIGDDKGNLKRVVSEEDELLRCLKNYWGDEIYHEVLTALKDLYEYNPSRSHTVTEIWNFRENRKAKLDEVISYILEAVKETRELDMSQEDMNHKRQRLDDKKEKAHKNLLKEKENLKRSYQNLLARDQKRNDELHGVRQELIKGLNEWQSGNKCGIGIKHMGEIDVKVFKRACRKRDRPSQDRYEALALHSEWQEKLKNPNWYPFRMVKDDMGNSKREEDESLRSLKQTWGDEVYIEVVTALKDLYEYNPSRSHTVTVIWNFGENRKAKLEEVISFVFTDICPWKTYSRRKRAIVN